jgi:hypothetical protein
VQAVKAGKFEDRYENALVELLNQEAQARAGTNGRETARYRQRRQPDGCVGKSLNDASQGVRFVPKTDMGYRCAAERSYSGSPA